MDAKKRQRVRELSHYDLALHIAREQLKQEREAAWARLGPDLKRLWDVYWDEMMAVNDRYFEANCKAIDAYFEAQAMDIFET